MPITVEAVYENGVLKPKEPLPLTDHEPVRVVVHRAADIQAALDAIQRSYGLIGWTGDSETLHRIAEEDEFGILESP